MKKATIKATEQVKWTQLEFARRIVENLVRYEFIAREKAPEMFKRMHALIIKENLSMMDMRKLSAQMSRNAKNASRVRVASTLIKKLKHVA